MNTAKIVRLHSLGGPEVLKIEELPLVTPKAGEVRIKVQAIGLNRAEVMFRTGHYLEQPEFPSRIGGETAGVIDAVGPDVTELRVGDKVSVATGQSMGRYGTYGESAAGTLKPIIAKSFPLSQIQAAHSYMESNQQLGKIVVTNVGFRSTSCGNWRTQQGNTIARANL